MRLDARVKVTVLPSGETCPATGVAGQVYLGASVMAPFSSAFHCDVMGHTCRLAPWVLLLGAMLRMRVPEAWVGSTDCPSCSEGTLYSTAAKATGPAWRPPNPAWPSLPIPSDGSRPCPHRGRTLLPGGRT